MISKFKPEVDKVYFINQNTLFHILDGIGGIQVDFNNYFNWEDKLIFLESGQYIKFLSDSFTVRKIVFEDKALFENKSVRVLFKHLVSLGYIDYLDCADCQKYLTDTLFDSPKDIIDVSSKQWYWQNPFDAELEEYHVIFDIKDLVDSAFKYQLSNEDVVRTLNRNNKNAHLLVKEKIGLTVKNLFHKKRILETKKELGFSDKSIKEISYEFGYKDPSYFNKVFKKEANLTPKQFREFIAHEKDQLFTNELFKLLKEFHTEQRKIDFYAKKLLMSKKSLSRQVRDKLNISIGQLIRFEIIKTAKEYLHNDLPISETAFALGFKEVNHFSTFFKHYTNQTPVEYIQKKYHN